MGINRNRPREGIEIMGTGVKDTGIFICLGTNVTKEGKSGKDIKIRIRRSSADARDSKILSASSIQKMPAA